MRSIVVLALLAAALAACSDKPAPAPAAAAPTPAPEAMAAAPAVAEPQPALAGDPAGMALKVNGQTVTVAEFNAMVGHQQKMAGFGTPGGPPAGPPSKEVVQQALKTQIDQLVLYDAAVKAGFGATEAKVDEQVEQMKQGLPPGKTIEDMLSMQGMNLPQFRRIIQQSLSIRPYIEKLTDGVTIPDADVRAAFEADKERFATKEQIQASHILVKTEDEAKAALARVTKGEKFEEVAKAVSTCPSGKSGGDLGMFGRGQMVKPFEEAAFGLKKEGDLSGIVPTQFGFHIIKLTGRQAAGAAQFETVAQQIRDKLTNDGKRSLVEKTIAELTAAATIEKAAGLP